MKILYAYQLTGNGHAARAQEIIPILKEFADVDILASGTQSQLKLDSTIKYKFKGISLFYNKSGGISNFKTLFKNNYALFIKNCFQVSLNNYDLVINDFEPVTAWAAFFNNTPIISLSHQSSLWFNETPKPDKIDFLSYLVLKCYAPIKIKYGFHFKSYHKNIFKPIIRSKIKNLEPKKGKNYLVYLPSFSDDKIIDLLNGIDKKFIVFSKNTKVKTVKSNCKFYPINETVFLKTLAKCKGVICNAGFELPTEALYLNKQLLVTPIKNQLEQFYNAKSLEDVGVTVAYKLNKKGIKNWMKTKSQIAIEFEENPEEIIKNILFEHVFKKQLKTNSVYASLISD